MYFVYACSINVLVNKDWYTAIETAGTWHNTAVQLTQEIGSRITIVTEDTKETAYLFQQRLSVAFQKGNAVSFRNTLLTE